MKIADLMTRGVMVCGAGDSLQRAAQIMWDNDCGCVPIVDGDGRLIAIVTDRDIAMAAYTQGVPLAQIPVSRVSSKTVFAVRESAPIEHVEGLMREKQVRRVPVVDDAGRPTGLVSIGDLARHLTANAGRTKAAGGNGIAQTIAAISQPRTRAGETREGSEARQRAVSARP